MDADEIKYEQWKTGNSAILLIAKKDGIITEREFRRLHDVVERLMPKGVARESLPAELLIVLRSVRIACVVLCLQ